MKRFKLISLLTLLIVGIFYLPAVSQTEFSDSIYEEVPLPFVYQFVAENPIDSITETFDYKREFKDMRVAVVLSDIYSKKDMEFMRGLLLGIKDSGLPANTLTLKVINGEITTDSLNIELSSFEPQVILSTFEKNASPALYDYCLANSVFLLNIFNTRNDDYLSSQNMIQLLPPSDKFNQEVAEYVLDNFAGNTFVMIGDPDPNDTLIRQLILAWPEEELMILSKDDLNLFHLEDEINYLIYPLYNEKDEVGKTMTKLLKLIADTPSAGVGILGRPNWITFSDLPSMISNMEVYIPAKCYFDPNADGAKRFIKNYNNAYGHTPIRSYPVYAVMGYDTSTYFFPILLYYMNGDELEWEDKNMLQSYFSLKKSGINGTYNSGGMILHYEPWGTMSKEIIHEK